MPSQYLASLTASQRADLERRLLDTQMGHCFICEEPVDLILQHDHIDIDHIQPLADKGKDDQSNFALTHSSCNRSKQASDLRVARVMARFNRLHRAVQDAGRESPNLGDILRSKTNRQYALKLNLERNVVRFGFPDLQGVDANEVYEASLYTDPLSGMRYFFALIPIAYLHHDDRINPRGIGSNLRGLVEEFFKGRPQLHVSLAWISSTGDAAWQLNVFDGQHKAAAQILLDVSRLPVRVFLDPDIDVLLQANTNAGSTLRQVAFDKSVLRHLGSALYRDRIERYQQETGRLPDSYDFSEVDLVRFFSGEAREIRRYILDNVRDGITHHPENRLRQYLDFAGKGNVKPVSYSAVDKTFYSFFISSEMLETPIGYGLDTGENPRELEKDQIVRLMSLISEVIFEGQFDLERGTYRIENKIQSGEDIPESHLRAYRMAREEIMYIWLSYIRQIVGTFYAFQGVPFTETKLFQIRHPEALWTSLRNYLINLRGLPLWVNRDLSVTVFGGKQNYEFWNKIFTSGKSSQGHQVLAEPLNLTRMIQN